MGSYRFDGKAFFKTLLTSILYCGVAATIFALFWEDKPAQEKAVKQNRDKLHVYLELLARDVAIGVGIGAALGVVMGSIGAFSRRRQTGVWGE